MYKKLFLARAMAQFAMVKEKTDVGTCVHKSLIPYLIYMAMTMLAENTTDAGADDGDGSLGKATFVQTYFVTGSGDSIKEVPTYVKGGGAAPNADQYVDVCEAEALRGHSSRQQGGLLVAAGKPCVVDEVVLRQSTASSLPHGTHMLPLTGVSAHTARRHVPSSVDTTPLWAAPPPLLLISSLKSLVVAFSFRSASSFCRADSILGSMPALDVPFTKPENTWLRA